MKKHIYIMAAVSATISSSAIGANWNFTENQFNQDGEVSLNMESGQVITIDDKTSMYTRSTAPTVVNLQQNTNGAFPFSNSGTNKSVTFDPDGYSAGVYNITFSETCIISRISAYASKNVGGNNYQDATDLTVIYNNERHSGLYAVGQWTNGTLTRELIADGKFYIPAGAQLEMRVNSSCSVSAGMWCVKNFNVDCIPTSF